ncbi:hypothetical protein [Vibrio sp. 1565-1]|uniref:hypothetical protein n=1 Tax=Vibrio sp. 1565-1 TaxID=3074563 RepID=UPI002964755B|nr:hypothetical protein [Vibrio sp. 1565-1]
MFCNLLRIIDSSGLNNELKTILIDICLEDCFLFSDCELQALIDLVKMAVLVTNGIDYEEIRILAIDIIDKS